MKKFFILICGILLATNAFCKDNIPRKPYKVDEGLRGKWGLYPWTFNKDLSGTFMSSWMIGYDHQAGTCDAHTEGAGVAIIATNIFDNGNGAEFCARQIQAHSISYSWIDFYDTKDYNKDCFTVCKEGYYGTGCKSTTFSGCDDRDYTNEFPDVKSADWLDITNTYCHDTSKLKTEDTPVFHYVIDNNNDSQVYVLGVKSVKPHGIIVEPVQIAAKRGNDRDAWIESVKGNGNTFALCAAGYVPNSDNSDCVPGASCGSDTDKLNNLCAGFSKNNYKSDEHSLVYNNSGKCYNVRCQNHKGFSSEYNTTCVECPGAPLAYVNNDGVCDMCDRGKYPNGTSCSNTIASYDKVQMYSNRNNDCWLKTKASEYSDCVKKQ